MRVRYDTSEAGTGLKAEVKGNATPFLFCTGNNRLDATQNETAEEDCSQFSQKP